MTEKAAPAAAPAAGGNKAAAAPAAGGNKAAAAPAAGGNKAAAAPAAGANKAAAAPAANIPQPEINTATMRMLGQTTRIVNRAFKILNILTVLLGILLSSYWAYASGRYVSEAVFFVQNTDTAGAGDTGDLLSMFSGNAGNKTDQLVLREYLLSLDMMKKADKKLHLREHYSDPKNDFFSRMWFKSIETEWFYRYFMNRVGVYYDEFSGVVRLRAEAFDAKTAYELASLLVSEGESFMNRVSHEIANEQVVFLEKQVDLARQELLKANQNLLSFQNRKNLSSPTAEVEGYQKLILDLEKQKSELTIRINSLPPALAGGNQLALTLKNNLEAVETQLARVRGLLTSNGSTALNELVEQEQLYKMDVEFKKEIYSSALTGLVKGQMNAARLIKHVSVIQAPSKPEYAMKPDRIYCFFATWITLLLVMGMFQLLKAVILDHVD
ncbi:MAG: hypothetical protein VZR11_10275 [Succinimonas sp.]|nr:hypothetical protein [Succinimonas sp.]